MKHNCMTILKVSVALILALMMVVGCISTVVAATITIEQAEGASDSTVTDVADAPDATGNDAPDEPVPSGALVDKLADRVDDAIAGADAQPAQSAPLTDKLVRRVKDDIAGTGANVDLAGTGWNTSGKDNLHIKIGSGDWATYNVDSNGKAYFQIGVTCYCEWELYHEVSGEAKKFNNKAGEATPRGDMEDYTEYWARRTTADDGGTGTQNFCATLPAGEYVCEFTNGQDWHLGFKFYRKPIYLYGNIDAPGSPGNAGTWDGTKHKYMTFNGSAYCYDIVGDGNEYRFRGYADGHNYYPTTSPYNLEQKTSYADSYTAGDGSSNNYFYIIASKGLTYHIWLQSGKLWVTKTVTFEIYGSYDGGNWKGDSIAMTYSGTSGRFYYEMADASSISNVLWRFWDGTNNYYGNASNDVPAGVGEANKTTMLKQASDPNTGAFTYSGTAGWIASYRIWADISGATTYTWIVPVINEVYYVTNNESLTTGNWDMDDPDGAMSLSSGTTWTKTFTGLNAGQSNPKTYQFRITDGTNWKTSSSTPAPTGNVIPGMTGNNITFTLGATDTSWNVTITYNSSTYDVTVNAQEVAEEEVVEVTGWQYSGVAAANRTEVDPTDGFTSNSSYHFVYANDDGMGNHVVPSKHSGSQYWIDLDGKYTAGTNFYIGISSNNTKDSLFGNNSNKINGATPASNNTDITITDTNSATLFKIQRCENNGRYYILIYGIDSTKVSDIGIVADIGNCTDGNQGASAVDYKIYYKAVGGGASSTKTYTVYAKDGTITSTNDVNGLGAYATTSITNNTVLDSYTTGQADSDPESEYYCTGTLSLNKTTGETKTLTVQTAVTTTNGEDDKLYVKGWCVNGETYGFNESDTVASDGVYTFNLPVTYEKFKTDTVIEITPIFYLVGAKTVSFRVENFDQRVQSADWGNTLYAYPFYGALSNVENSFGAYPGQPLLYYQGKYSIQIPIESLSLNPDKATTNGTIVRGITLNNGYYDSVHKTASGWSNDPSKHKQTYDFDDFYKIYNEKQGNDIIFRFKYRDGSLTYNRDNYFSTSKTTLDADDLTGNAGDKSWELLTDRLGRVIDVFGNPILKENSTTVYATNKNEVAGFENNVLRVISMGYFDNNAGEYATEWVIFKQVSGTYTRIQSGNNTDYKFSIVPSALLLNNENRFSTSVYKTYRDKPVGQYKDLYNVLKTEAAGKPVYISYERDQLRTNNAMRCDGRWYYTTKNDYVQSKIKIQYKTPSGAYIDDTYSAPDNASIVTGQTTGAKAYFTNSKYDLKRESLSEIYSAEPKDYYTFEAVDGDLYQFAGWYLEVDGNTDHPTYTAINPDKDGGYSMSRTSSDVLVARFDPIKAGNVKVSHTVTAGSGTAQFKVESDISGSYTTIRDFSSDNYTIPSTYIKQTNSNKHIRITLQTTPGTDNTFSKFEASEATKVEDEYFENGVKSGSGPYLNQITISIGTLLENNTASLTYYSELNAPTYKYEITYSFESSRLKTTGGANATISYTSKGDFTAKQYGQNVTITGSGTISGDDRKLKDSFISTNVPHESNFKQILALNLADVSHSCTQDTTGGNNVITQKATVSFSSSPDKALTGTIDLPYQFDAAVGSAGKGAYAAKNSYVDYTNLKEYTTDAEIASLPDGEGVLEDHSTEPFNLNTYYGGYFVSSAEKDIDMKDVNNARYIITAPETILKSDSKTVKKYTMDTNGDGTWAYYGAVGSDAYEAEMKRLLSIEGWEDNETNRAEIVTRYTKDGKKVYRISNETHYIPDGGKIKYFHYWSIQNINGEEVARCYNNDLNYLAFEDYYITPKYSEEQPGERTRFSTSISWMGESRNQWNNNGGSTIATKAEDGTYGLMREGDGAAADYIWEDFAVDFEAANGAILKSSNVENDQIKKMGVVVQVAGPRVEGKTSSYDYKELYESGETLENTENIEAFLKTKYTDSPVSYTGTYSALEIQRSNLNNKNRGDYFIRIANSRGWNDETDQPATLDANYSNNALRVYSFIVTSDGDVYLSEKPAYFCTYGIAKQ